jgi:hypothetical protein
MACMGGAEGDMMWQSMSSWEVDAMLGVDTGVWKEDGSGRAMGAGAKSEVVVRSRARVHWGGEGMGGVFTPGMPKSLGGVKGGCCALMHEGYSPKVMEVLVDERGWGRMSGVVVRGVEGRRLLLLDVYWPVRSGDELVGAMWNRQSQEMTIGWGW